MGPLINTIELESFEIKDSLFKNLTFSGSEVLKSSKTK